MTERYGPQPTDTFHEPPPDRSLLLSPRTDTPNTRNIRLSYRKIGLNTRKLRRNNRTPADLGFEVPGPGAGPRIGDDFTGGPLANGLPRSPVPEPWTLKLEHFTVNPEP